MAKLAATATMLAGIAWLASTFLMGPVAPPAFASVLEPVVHATGEADAVHVIMSVRTREGEDFLFVDPHGALMRVDAWVEWPRVAGAAGRLRIEKSDRIYSFDGARAVLYLPSRNEAYRIGSGLNLELFWPAAWVRHLQSLPSKGVEVIDRRESERRGRLVLREAGAVIENREPAFLGEFDRETEVEWNLETERLTGLRRFVDYGGDRIMVSEIESIEYLPALDAKIFEPDLPGDVRWGGVHEGPLELLDLGPREVALRFFDAVIEGDRATLELLCPSPSTVDRLLDDERRATKIYFIGEPFRTGRYAGVYVPYKVRFGSDLFAVKQHNLALRNDNPQNRWVFDGGI